MNILIFGVTGMAGHVIYDYLINEQDTFNVVGVSYRKKINKDTILVDVNDSLQVQKIINLYKPKYIINAVGVLIKGSKNSISNTIFINSYFPNFLTDMCRKINAKLIHISTDCVFSGLEGNYFENSYRDADDLYGRSKALGEINNNEDITIRTSIIGPELKEKGEGLFHWFFNQSGEIKGYDNVFWGGVTTLELAKFICFILEKDITGIFNLTNNKKISKFQILQNIQEVWGVKDVFIQKYSVETPKDKSLKNKRLVEYDLIKTYRDMLIEMKEFMLHKNSMYKYSDRYKLN